MLKFIKFFQGYLHVCVSGYSPERFLNLCSKRNIVLWCIKPEKEGYSFFISKKAFGMIEPALEKTGTQIQVNRKIGIPFLIRKYKKHCFFFVGIACALFVLYYMSQFIWNVDITGNSYYSTQLITDFLEENHSGYATKKSKINCKELQTLLRKHYEDITWVSAKIEGTRLYLVIQERLKGIDPEKSADGKTDLPTNLVAANDGVIASITTRQGTPLVTVGDTVSAGDVLVSGAVNIENDSGEVASVNYVSSDADVMIHTDISYQDSFSRNYEKKVLTGKKKHNIILMMNRHFFKLLPLKQEDDYIQESSYIPVLIGSDFYLPFQVINITHHQYRIVQATYTDEEIKALVEEHLNKYYEKLAENGIQILSNSVIIEQSGDNVLAGGNLEVLAKQQDYQQISEEEMQEGINVNGTDTTDD